MRHTPLYQTMLSRTPASNYTESKGLSTTSQLRSTMTSVKSWWLHNLVPDFIKPIMDYCVHKILLLDQILTRLTPVHIFTSSLPIIHYTNTLPSMSMSPTWTSLSMSSGQQFIDSLHFPVSKCVPTCFAHHMLLPLIIITVLCDEFKLWSSSPYRFIHHSAASSFVHLNILLRILFATPWIQVIPLGCECGWEEIFTPI
jgi:hypothetical protein